jgi:uncharacterized protein (UPF0332 family)
MQWSDFQDTAERLARGATEGDWRSAMSRCYYAVFHFFRSFLLSHGLDVGRGGQSHFNLYSGLLNCGFSSVAAVAARIDRLRKNRVDADYNLSWKIIQADSLSLVPEGRALVTDFQSILSTLSPAMIVDGAKRHLQSIGRLGKTP